MLGLPLYRVVESVSASGRKAAVSAALAAVLLLAPSPAALALDWEIETVDDAINWIGSSVAIVVGNDGTPHIGHGAHPTQIVRYAVKVGNEWLIEEADGYPTGLCAAIALDPSGNPCLAYLDWDSLTFARRVDSIWTHETIDLMHADARCALGFSIDGIPHIAYCKQGDPWNLKHACKPADTWLIETADPTVAAGNDIDMVIDHAGNPHISHWAAPNYGDGPFETRYTRWNGSEWLHDIIDDTGENLNVIQSGIALDADGNPHIAYFTHDWSAPDVKYAVWNGVNWDITTVEANLPSSAACHLVLDRTSSPHVVYGTGYCQSGGSSELRYAYLDEVGDWVIEVIDGDGDAGELNSLALDLFGYLHVAYFRGPGAGQNGEIRYARSTTPVCCPGDVNGDGKTDLSDLAELLAAYGSSIGDPHYNPSADFDRDGDVDLADLAFLLADYGCGG